MRFGVLEKQTDRVIEAVFLVKLVESLQSKSSPLRIEEPAE